MPEPAARDDATATDAWLDSLDPAAIEFRDARHVREIIAAADDVSAAEGRLSSAIAAARAAGDSWAVIGAALGVTRQAAFQRFGSRTEATTAVVSQNGRGRWTVTKQAARRASVIVETQAEAVLRARSIVQRSGGGEVVVHGTDGTIVSTSRITAEPGSPRQHVS